MNLGQFNPAKILSHWNTLGAILENQNPPPVTCGFDASNSCNHDCIWCMCRDFKERKNTVMPPEIMFDLIQELGAGGVKSITFTGGGEPLVNPATSEGLYRARKAGLEVGLITNGGLMRDVSKAIVDTCKFVRISLDAANHETHTRLHRPKDLPKDNFGRILENIEAVISLRKRANKQLTVGVSFLAHLYNFTEIYETAILVKKLGVDYIQIRPALPWTGELMRETQSWSLIQSQIERSQELEDSRFSVFSILHKFNKGSTTERAYSRCLAHSLISIIGADCNVYLCCQFRGDIKFSFGDLRKKSFFEIWDGEERKRIIKRISLEDCPPCRYAGYNELLHCLNNQEKIHKNFL